MMMLQASRTSAIIDGRKIRNNGFDQSIYNEIEMRDNMRPADGQRRREVVMAHAGNVRGAL